MVETVHVRGRYPEDRAVPVLLSYPVSQLEGYLRLAYPTEADYGSLGCLFTGKELALEVGGERLAARESGIAFEGYGKAVVSCKWQC
jgi:hypothetical protein